MTKSYKGIRLKKHRVYSVEQLVSAYSVTPNTVSNWVKDGLQPSDGKKPYLFRGAAVEDFHKRKRLTVNKKLQPGQFQCWGCQTSVFPDVETVVDYFADNGRHMYTAVCPYCSTKLQKISSETDRDLIEDCRNPNTPTECLHEEKASVRGGIWSKAENDVPNFQAENDRIIHKWQTYAGGYSEKTIDKHLAAIRFFERNLKGKSFAKLNTDDFAAVRDELKRLSKAQSPNNLSASTIKHYVSHLTAFFDWLLKQEGYRRLPGDFAGYLKLPKAIVAQATQVKQKDYPTLFEAEELLDAMPRKSLVDLRARAIFALAFLGALRADTLASLRVKNVDIERRLILQDASIVRTKAGKSLNIIWFQIPEAFEKTVVDWVVRLQNLGFTGEDALFPDTKNLKHRIRVPGRDAAPVPVLSTTHAVTHAFSVASQNSEVKYTPHAAKHTIGAERDIRSLTHEERKAWSLNMGHDSELTTERHYGTMPDDRRFEVLEGIGSKRTIDPRNLSESEKAKIFDSMFEAFSERR